MALQSAIGLSTTSTLEGWVIEEYLGPVSAHVVAGTGFFSDLFAGFSDFFGGRSFAYQHQLQSLNTEVLRSLQVKAARLQANWVVGMSVDLDEVSGKGVQMFMVTATGTAVRARRVTRERLHTDSRANHTEKDGGDTAHAGGRASQEQVRALMQREIIQRAIGEGTLVLDDETWNTIIGGGLVEAADFVLREVARSLRDEVEPSTRAAIGERASAYFAALGEGAAVKALYRAVRTHADLLKAAVSVLRRQNLCDYQSIIDVLENGSPEERRRILQVLEAAPEWFSEEDVRLMKRIVELCKDVSTFPPYAILEESRGVFGKHEELKCACGEKRPVGAEYCLEYTCLRDGLGFRKREITPKACVQSLEETIRVVRQLL